MTKRRPARNTPKSFSTDSPGSLLDGNSTAQQLGTVEDDSVIEIMRMKNN